MACCVVDVDKLCFIDEIIRYNEIYIKHILYEEEKKMLKSAHLYRSFIPEFGRHGC